MINPTSLANTRRQAGFTMVELAIVLVIAGIILVAVLKGTDMINKAKIERVAADLKGLQGMLLEHEKRTGRMPGDCNENGIIGFTGIPQTAVENNTALAYSVTVDPDADRCLLNTTAETDANLVWSDLRKANIVDPTRTNLNLTKHTLTDFYTVGSFTPTTPAGGPVNTIIAYGLPLWLAKGIDVAIDGAQTTGSELTGGRLGRVRFWADDSGTPPTNNNGTDWPTEDHDYQFVSISFQFDTRMSRPAP